MVTLAVFALGLLCGSLGVFSFLLLEAIVCVAAFVDGWSAGLGEACLESVDMGADLTAGFVVALFASFPAAKLRFASASQPQPSQAGLACAASKRPARP